MKEYDQNINTDKREEEIGADFVTNLDHNNYHHLWVLCICSVGPAVAEYLHSLHGDEHTVNQSPPVQLKFKIEYV